MNGQSMEGRNSKRSGWSVERTLAPYLFEHQATNIYDDCSLTTRSSVKLFDNFVNCKNCGFRHFVR